MAEEDADCDLAENLSLQLSEVEMLTSMFPEPNEFCLDETVETTQIQRFIDGEIQKDRLHARVGFTLNISVGEPAVTVEVICQLAYEYPSVPPNVFLRAPTLTRAQHSRLTEELLNYVDQLERGDLYIGHIIQWLQDNASEFITSVESPTHEKNKNLSKMKSPKRERTFSRMWIYSHHLYSKIKRKDILFYSGELNLTGFSMTGKPGMIVIEGLNSCVEEFWGRIRRMQWKRIVMKEKEDFVIPEDKTEEDLRKFDGFSERIFAPRLAKGRAHHGDRGLLFSFLDERGCGHIFPLFFGVEGRPAEPDSD